MRSLCRFLTIAAAVAAFAGLSGTANAVPTLYEWEYIVDGTPSGWLPVTANPSNTSGTATASLFGGDLQISISTTSNNPGTALGAEIFNATLDVTNSTDTGHTVAVYVGENNYTMPTVASALTASVSNVSVAQTSPLSSTLGTASFIAGAGEDQTNTIGTSATYVTNNYNNSASGAGVTGISLPGGTLSGPGPITPTAPFALIVANQVTMGGNTTATISVRADLTPIPEPSTMALAALGTLGLIGYGLRRRKAMGA